MQETKPNYEHLGFNTYMCRTQAGFKQALKHFGKRYEITDGRGNNASLQNLKDRLRGYPKCYPSKVEFSYVYCGGDYDIVAKCLPVRKAVEVLSKFLDKLKGHK